VRAPWIVSQLDEPVGFHRSLSGRVANVVPVDDPRDVLPAINAYTQTIGIWPETLKTELRDELALHGAQRLVSLGYAADPSMALPQDAIEPVAQDGGAGSLTSQSQPEDERCSKSQPQSSTRPRI